MSADYEYAVINHAVEYVNGNVDTNTMENSWSLLKRDPHGTYVERGGFSLGALHCPAGLFNTTSVNTTDADRFVQLRSMVAGKRLTWNDVTGKNAVER